MSFGNPLKSALHHWWPQSLSRFWAGPDGKTTQLFSDGRDEVRSPPSNFGAITNAHHIKFSEDNPWNSTFEDTFGPADTEFPFLADWLLKLDTKQARPRALFQDRFLAQPLPPDRRKQIAKCLSSLIVRSPGSRNRIRITVESYHQKFGMTDYKANKNLIAGNMHGCHSVFTQAIMDSGKFVVIVSDTQEFICGDGFLHNFPPNADRPLSPRCIVPLLPSVTVLFVQPQTFRTHPELMTLRLTKDEVVFFNTIVQIYSRDFVFFRNDRPSLIEAFQKRQFLEFPYHQQEWLEQLIASAISFLPEDSR